MAATTTPVKEDGSFATHLYNAISSAIGGSNNNQFLCLQFPGTILSADDYRYDYKSGEEKPKFVAANESRLANKMFDPCRITSADNGFSLPYQYKSALDMLTPKIDSKIAEYKNVLRQNLLCDYPYDFGDGEKIYTLQEVYFRLYDEYIDELRKWANDQAKEKERLRKQNLSELECNDKFYDWYEREAERRQNIIDEKKAKVLSVFAPNDMKALEGVLDSGSGAELQDARQSINYVRKPSPTGGYIYPVKFYPNNWFEMLGTSFTSADLIKGTDALLSDLQNITGRRSQLYSFLINIGSIIAPYYSEVNSLINEINSLKKQIKTSQQNMVKVYGSAAVKVVAPIATLTTKKIALSQVQRLSANVSLSLAASRQTALTNLINRRLDTEREFNNRLAFLHDSLKAALYRACSREESLNSQLYKDYLVMFPPVNDQLEQINRKIEEIQKQITIATQFENGGSENAVPVVPKGFTQVSVTLNASDLSKDTQYVVSKKAFTAGTSFLFQGKDFMSSSDIANFSSKKWDKSTIKITMNVAKIGIERDWFNPGVFSLTKDMLKLGKNKISPSREDYGGVTEERLKDMEKCVFPCYPMAMLIARDIMIEFKFQSEEVSKELYEIMERHASSGGGFFMFQNSSRNSSSGESGVHTSMRDEVVTVKIDSTQLIGYYMEATKADLSESFDVVNSSDPSQESLSGAKGSNYTSIFHYIDRYNSILRNKVSRLRVSPVVTNSVREEVLDDEKTESPFTAK